MHVWTNTTAQRRHTLARIPIQNTCLPLIRRQAQYSLKLLACGATWWQTLPTMWHSVKPTIYNLTLKGLTIWWKLVFQAFSHKYPKNLWNLFCLDLLWINLPTKLRKQDFSVNWRKQFLCENWKVFHKISSCILQHNYIIGLVACIVPKKSDIIITLILHCNSTIKLSVDIVSFCSFCKNLVFAYP